MYRQSFSKVNPGIAKNVMELMIVAIRETPTTHPGMLRLAKKYASAELFRRAE